MRSFVETLSAWGIDSGTQVVAYDDSGGSIAARLWWMLNWVGHRQAAVLDGGWPPWIRAGLPTRGGPEYRPLKRFIPNEILGALVSSGQVMEMTRDSRHVILDARSAPRFRGEVEPIDPVAGHIPGAVSAPYDQNLTPEGTFLPPDALRKRFEQLVKSVPPENVICYCGSGVTAAHNLVAMAHAGLGMGRLYPGSWSEWITDSTRPVAKGIGNKE
jgi:thiosulfate/3-mercaptopyruvate sulfurtransferase